jgi:hypothetical protein
MSELNKFNSTPYNASASSGDTFSGFFSNKNAIIIVLLFLLILSMIGINLLQITGNIIEDIADPLGPLVRGILSSIGFTAGNLLKGSADVVAGTVDTGVDIAKGTTYSIGDLLINTAKPGIDYSKQFSLSDALGIPKLQMQQQTSAPQPVQSSEPTVTPISTQKAKAGWCYIGDFKGVKGCVEITDHDKCMSGQVFPSKEACFNPK